MIEQREALPYTNKRKRGIININIKGNFFIQHGELICQGEINHNLHIDKTAFERQSYSKTTASKIAEKQNRLDCGHSYGATFWRDITKKKADYQRVIQKSPKPAPQPFAFREGLHLQLRNVIRRLACNSDPGELQHIANSVWSESRGLSVSFITVHRASLSSLQQATKDLPW